jgi:membrane protein DedA with SNARE-associated domain
VEHAGSKQVDKGAVVEQILGEIQHYGSLFYLLTFLWTAIEGETFVIFAGYAAHLGLLDLHWLILAAWAGSFCGDQVYFFLGWRYGPRLVKRFPKWQPSVDRAMDLLLKYNIGFILSFRFIYGVRNVSSFAIGLAGVSWARFSILNFFAAGIWATSFAGTGYLFGAAFKELLGKSALYVSLGMLVLFISLGWWFLSAPTRKAKRDARLAEAAEKAGTATPVAKATDAQA